MHVYIQWLSSFAAQSLQEASQESQHIAKLREMFPQFDDDIVTSVYRSCNKELGTAATKLLMMQEDQ
jgi:hypothetical protein